MINFDKWDGWEREGSVASLSSLSHACVHLSQSIKTQFLRLSWRGTRRGQGKMHERFVVFRFSSPLLICRCRISIQLYPIGKTLPPPADQPLPPLPPHHTRSGNWPMGFAAAACDSRPFVVVELCHTLPSFESSRNVILLYLVYFRNSKGFL